MSLIRFRFVRMFCLLILLVSLALSLAEIIRDVAEKRKEEEIQKEIQRVEKALVAEPLTEVCTLISVLSCLAQLCIAFACLTLVLLYSDCVGQLRFSVLAREIVCSLIRSDSLLAFAQEELQQVQRIQKEAMLVEAVRWLFADEVQRNNQGLRFLVLDDSDNFQTKVRFCSLSCLQRQYFLVCISRFASEHRLRSSISLA